MQDARLIPDDLATCQEKLRDALSLQAQLEEACLTMHAQQEQLQREVEELELTVKRLLNQLYGRRSERLPESAGQQHLNFGEEETSDSSLLSALDEADAEFVEQIIERRQVAEATASQRVVARASDTSYGADRAEFTAGCPLGCIAL